MNKLIGVNENQKGVANMEMHRWQKTYITILKVCNAHHRNSLKKCYNTYLFIVTFKKIEILQYIGRIKVGQYCFGKRKCCNILQYIAIIYCSHKSERF